MLEVKDEILAGEPLYRIKDKEGKILFDNLTIEMITPVIQSPSLLNKAYFNSIHDHLLLNSKYHMLKGLKSDYTDYKTPALTQSNPQGHSVSWDYLANIGNAPANAYEMFGGDLSKYVMLTPSNGVFLDLFVTLPKPVKITEVGGWAERNNYNYTYVYLTLSGKLNSSDTYEEIGRYSPEHSGFVAVSTDKAFKYIKLKFTSAHSQQYVNIRNGLYIYGKALEKMSFTEEIEEDLNETLTKGQVIHVETQNDYDICSNITYKIKTSESQSVKMPLDLVAGQKYRLVYNGTEFEHEKIYKDMQLTNAIVSLGGSL